MAFRTGSAEWAASIHAGNVAAEKKRAAYRAKQAGAGLTPISAITDAMKETQRRAAEDRKLALAGVTGRETQATGAITTGREKGISEYDATQELLAEARKEVSPEREAMMYESGRIPIEAGTQAGLRGIQERYARGGAPGSAAIRMMGDVESAGAGQKSELQRQIQLDRYQKLMGLTGQAGQVAGAKATIFGQEGRSLADIYGTTGRTLADIYKHTIAKVPEYPEIPSYTPSYGGGTTTTSGGSMRSAAPSGGGIGGGTTAIDRFQQLARGGAKKMVIRNGKFVQQGTW